MSEIKNNSLFLRNILRMKAIKQSLGFDANKDFYIQKKQVGEKYLELVKIPDKETEPTPIIEYTDENNPDYDEIRFSFESEIACAIKSFSIGVNSVAEENTILSPSFSF